MTRILLICLSLLRPGWVLSAEQDDALSLTDMGPHETPSRHASGTVTYNLGPTGARGWIRAYNGGELFWGENGREILVSRVDPGSPADGTLDVFDVIVGADGQTFETDAFASLGQAIARAQRADGMLSLERWRNGAIQEVSLALPPLEGDAASAPIVAAHSQALRGQFSEFVARSMHPDGFQMHASYASLNALFLLANGKPEHLDQVRRHIRNIIDRMEGPDSVYGPWGWVTGPNTILLAEYFLATGDRSVLSAIEQNLKWMRASQSYAGGFGHGGSYGGYGHVALPGLFCAIGATLARECGVSGFDDVIGSAGRFFARAVGLGIMGYGGYDASIHLRTIYGDNGKSGAAAVLFDVLGDRQTSRTYADTAGALAAYSQSGHSGNFWSFSWGAVGANRASRPHRDHFAEELDGYYAMARTWHGGMTSQPWRASMGSYAPGGEELATGGMALWYCTPLKSLRILGGETSVLSQDLPGPLADARQLLYQNRYRDCIEALDRFNPAREQEAEQAGKLKAIAARGLKTLELTLASIKSNIDQGDLFTAERQLHALTPILADPAVIEPFERKLNTEASAAVIAAGRTYYGAMGRRPYRDREFFHRAPAIVFDATQRARMQALAESGESGSYARMAARALEQWAPQTSAPDFKTLVDEEVTATGEVRDHRGRDADAEPAADPSGEFAFQVDDPAGIRTLKLRARASDPVIVVLNDQVICRFHTKRKRVPFDGSWGEWEDVTLRPEALRLLRRGENTLGVIAASRQPNPNSATVRVQLQAVETAR